MDEDDRTVLRWPFWCVVGILVLPIPIFATEFGLFSVIFVAVLVPQISWPIAFLGLLVAASAAFHALRAARKGAWRRCLSALVLPLFVVVVWLDPRPVSYIWNGSGDWIRFQMEKPGYWSKINKLKADDGPRLAVFIWGGWGGIGESLMVYDESDEIILDESERSAAWKKRIQHTDLTCRFAAFPMEGHFYKAYLAC